ncbi:MAG: hypothetical protein VB101_03625 [Rhodospirillaceae bacterium]|nr:hypothetical protein [Rhodospirillaceae bacterium]
MYLQEHAATLKTLAGQSYRPGNFLEGDIFYSEWCALCHREEAHRTDPDAEGCPVLAAALIYDRGEPDYPAEWVWGHDGQPKCTIFSTTGTVEPRCPDTLDLFGTASGCQGGCEL